MGFSHITESYIRRTADSEAVHARGKRYWQQGRVRSIKIKGNMIEAHVRGSARYRVTLHKEKNRMIAGCTCPYEGNHCKHIVATLYALKDQASTASRSLKNKPSPFKSLTILDAFQYAHPLAVIEALDLLKKKHVKILTEEEDWTLIEVQRNGEEEHVDIEARLGENRKGSPIFWKQCSCKENSFRTPCVHRIAAVLFLIKKYAPSSIPSSLEEKIQKQYNEAQYRSLTEELSALTAHPIKESVPQRKPVQLLIGVTPRAHALTIGILKAQMKKDGTPGVPREIRNNRIRDYYDDAPAHMQRVLAYMLSQGDEWYGSLWELRPSAVGVQEKRNTQMLHMLRELYQEYPECFANVAIAKEKGVLEITLRPEKSAGDARYRLHTCLKAAGHSFDLANPDIRLFGFSSLWAYLPLPSPDHHASFRHGMLVEIESLLPKGVYALRNQKDLAMSEEQARKLLKTQYPTLASLGVLNVPTHYQPQEIRGIIPRLRLYLTMDKQKVMVEPRFLYGTHEIPALQQREIIFEENGSLMKIQRNAEEEHQLLTPLAARTIREGDVFFLPSDPLEWLADEVPALIAAGGELFGSDKLLSAPFSLAQPKLSLSVSSGIDWFDIKADVAFDKQNIPLSELASAIHKRERWVKLADGSLGIIPKHWIEKISGAISFLETDKKKKTLRAARAQFKVIDALSELAETRSVDDTYKEMREKFEKFEKIREYPLPRGFHGELREYQKAGYNWLHFLRDFSFGGCLADEMGLGKTIQVLALLLSEKENERASNPSLIVVPTSLIFNWQHEIQKFAPSLIAYAHHGPERKKRLPVEKDKIDIIITSYETLRIDEESFAKQQFHYIILDESQKIKNPITKNARTVTRLQGKHRLVLTGTPIENNYLDLWSQFTFLNPGLLGSHERFKTSFAATAPAKEKNAQTKTLRSIIYPFILMRKKEMVAKDLPEKQIDTVYGALTAGQEAFYNEWKEHYQKEIRETIERQGIQKSKLKILEGLMRLRQICNHPSLVDASYTGESAKLSLLMEYLDETLAAGRKALVFSSFVKMLQLVQKELEKQGTPYAYLDGSTRDRASVVREFQENDKVKIFLGSLKAGGLGLNLTAADQVFIIDPWWNPAAEMQAIDRAHRIGQDKKVFVYKIIMKGTIEEKILALQQTKQELIKDIMLHEKNVFKQLTKDDVMQLFA